LILQLESTVELPPAGYLALMTDRYPPFRLDQGSIDIEGPAHSLRPPNSALVGFV
jgi:hypothetical protein